VKYVQARTDTIANVRMYGETPQRPIALLAQERPFSDNRIFGRPFN
jgi:hypothetical protein